MPQNRGANTALCRTAPCHLRPFITPHCLPIAQTVGPAAVSGEGLPSGPRGPEGGSQGVPTGPTPDVSDAPAFRAFCAIARGSLAGRWGPPQPAAPPPPLQVLDKAGASALSLCPPPIPLGLLWVPDSCPALCSPCYEVLGYGALLLRPPRRAGLILSAPQQLHPLSSHLNPRPALLLFGRATPTPQGPSPRWHQPVR